MKQRLYNLIHHQSWFIRLVYIAILINVIALFIESYQVSPRVERALYNIELVSIIFFTIEYLMRIWVADLGATSFKESIQKRIGFVFSFYGMIDLLAILPFFIPLIFKVDLRSIRILRLLRLLRIFKLGRYSKSMRLISDVLKETKSELFVTLFICFILMIFSSTLMFYIETHAQPEKFQNAGQSLWWAVATLTTVGYGDIYPVTPIGKVLGAIIALIGIGFVALPTGIISSSFISKLNDSKKVPIQIQCTCPNCKTSFELEIKNH